jgi:hypothetical protein
MHKPKSKLLARILSLFLTCMIGLQLIAPAQAQGFVYIQASIDVATWRVLASVVTADIGTASYSLETRRIPQSARTAMSTGSASLDAGYTLLADTLMTNAAGKYDAGEKDLILLPSGGGGSTSDEKNNVLTFPGAQRKTDATSADTERAFAVMNALIHDLNGAFTQWLTIKGYDTNKTAKVSDFMARMTEFLGEMKSRTTANSDWLTLSDDSDVRYRWRMPKGYFGTHKETNLRDVASSDDAEYVNWSMLAYEGFRNFLLVGEESVTPNSVYAAEPNLLEKGIVGLFGQLLNGLRNALGMWTVDDLVFNEGYRSYGYVGGVFPIQWESIIWAIFMFMEILSSLVLLYGLVANVLKKALSTTNTVNRVRAMTQLQDIIVCAIALALLPIALRLVLQLSASLTEVFHGIALADSKVEDMVLYFGASSGTLAGIIVQFMFFGSQVYFNIFYGLRALSVAFLIMIAPVMIAMIGVGSTKKDISIQWAKELLAAICIQPIHALCISILLSIPITNSHDFDNLVSIYAIIPLGSMLRGLIFGNATGWMDNIAERGKKKAEGAVTAAAVAGTVGLAAGVGSAFVGGLKGVGSSANQSSNTGTASDDSGTGSGFYGGGSGGSDLGGAADKDAQRPSGGSLVEKGKAIVGAVKERAPERLKASAAGAKAGAKAAWDKKGAIMAGAALSAVGAGLGALGAGGAAGHTLASLGHRIGTQTKPATTGSGTESGQSTDKSTDKNTPQPLPNLDKEESTLLDQEETEQVIPPHDLQPPQPDPAQVGPSDPDSQSSPIPQPNPVQGLNEDPSTPLAGPDPQLGMEQQEVDDIRTQLDEKAKAQPNPIPISQTPGADALRKTQQYSTAQQIRRRQGTEVEKRRELAEEADLAGTTHRPYKLVDSKGGDKDRDGTPLTAGTYHSDGSVTLSGGSKKANGISSIGVDESNSNVQTITLDASEKGGLSDQDYQNMRLIHAIHEEGGEGKAALEETGIKDVHYDSGRGTYTMTIDTDQYAQNYQTEFKATETKYRDDKTGEKKVGYQTSVTVPERGTIVPDVSEKVKAIASRDSDGRQASEQTVQTGVKQYAERFAGAEIASSRDGGLQSVRYPCENEKEFKVMTMEMQGMNPGIQGSMVKDRKTGARYARFSMGGAQKGKPIVPGVGRQYGPTVQALLDEDKSP